MMVFLWWCGGGVSGVFVVVFCGGGVVVCGVVFLW